MSTEITNRQITKTNIDKPGRYTTKQLTSSLCEKMAQIFYVENKNCTKILYMFSHDPIVFVASSNVTESKNDAKCYIRYRSLKHWFTTSTHMCYFHFTEAGLLIVIVRLRVHVSVLRVRILTIKACVIKV